MGGQASRKNNNGGKKSVLNISYKKLQGIYTDPNENQISWRKKSQRNEFENGVALNSSFK